MCLTWESLNGAVLLLLSQSIDGTGIGDGVQNTTDILVQNCSAYYANPVAAILCDNSNAQGYSDWHLPSKDELSQLNVHSATIDSTSQVNGGSDLVGGLYWSSTEYTSDFAWYYGFSNNLPGGGFKYHTQRVRAVRSY
jgi:hypothetical protein